MTCQRVTNENLIERYLQGALDPLLRDEFEDHYFGCDHCHAQLQTVQFIKPVLADLPPPASPKSSRNYLPWLAVAAAAAALVIAFLPQPNSSVAPTAAPSAPLILLSEISPAPYTPALLRGGASQAAPAYAQAMRLYEQRQWSAAATALAPLAPDPAALHFAGVSHLLAGQTEPALDVLQRVIALGPRSPYEEEARFYRAQALLLARRPAEARQELETIIKLQGDYESPARSLLRRL